MSAAFEPNRRVLVVDDNTAIHADFVKVLGPPDATPGPIADLEQQLFGTARRQTVRREGFEVETALQGESAVEIVGDALAHDRPFAMAFVDMRMPPGWDGVETVSRLWRLDSRIEVVFCTAYSDHAREEIEQALGRSAQFLILKKPFDTIEVLQMASSLCEKWQLSTRTAARLAELESRVASLERTNAELDPANRESGTSPDPDPSTR